MDQINAAGLAIGLALQGSPSNFAAEQITIPYPQRDVHIYNHG